MIEEQKEVTKVDIKAAQNVKEKAEVKRSDVNKSPPAVASDAKIGTKSAELQP